MRDLEGMGLSRKRYDKVIADYLEEGERLKHERKMKKMEKERLLK